MSSAKDAVVARVFASTAAGQNGLMYCQQHSLQVQARPAFNGFTATSAMHNLPDERYDLHSVRVRNPRKHAEPMLNRFSIHNASMSSYYCKRYNTDHSSSSAMGAAASSSQTKDKHTLSHATRPGQHGQPARFDVNPLTPALKVVRSVLCCCCMIRVTANHMEVLQRRKGPFLFLR